MSEPGFDLGHLMANDPSLSKIQKQHRFDGLELDGLESEHFMEVLAKKIDAAMDDEPIKAPIVDKEDAVAKQVGAISAIHQLQIEPLDGLPKIEDADFGLQV